MPLKLWAGLCGGTVRPALNASKSGRGRPWQLIVEATVPDLYTLLSYIGTRLFVYRQQILLVAPAAALLRRLHVCIAHAVADVKPT